MQFLLKRYYTRDNEEYKFLAALQGIELDGESSEKEGSNSNHVSSGKETSQLLFGDPADYEKMSDKKREDLTNKMLAKHKSWAQSR